MLFRGPRPLTGPWPMVTVQIPVRDEAHVIGRLLNAVRELDYPNFEVQMLDDSEDETKGIVAKEVARLRAESFPIEVLWRRDNFGRKAGALNDGLKTAKGEFIAMFDADFVPPSDFLKRIVPAFFESDDIGFAQGRWTFLNETESWLTRMQSLLLSAYMTVEQPARSARGFPFTFNGTGGVWRRTCIDSAGGWHVDCVIEDLDLTCRAWMKGWKFRHYANITVPCRLPSTLRQFRFQQRRWTKGNAQIFRKYTLPILFAERPVPEKLALLAHILPKPAGFLLVFLSLLPWHGRCYGLRLAIGLLAFLTFYSYLRAGHLVRKSFGEVSRGLFPSHFAASVAGTVAFFTGFSLLSLSVYLQGLFIPSPEYVRTAKGPGYSSPFDSLCYFEILFGFACASISVISYFQGRYLGALFSIPIALCFIAVGALSLLSPERSLRSAND